MEVETDLLRGMQTYLVSFVGAVLLLTFPCPISRMLVFFLFCIPVVVNATKTIHALVTHN